MMLYTNILNAVSGMFFFFFFLVSPVKVMILLPYTIFFLQYVSRLACVPQ